MYLMFVLCSWYIDANYVLELLEFDPPQIPFLSELGAGLSGFWGGVLSELGSDTYYHFQGSS